MTTLRRRPAMGTALLALGLAATATAWACTPDHTGTLSVSPTSASPGDAVTVTASGLKLANAPYDVVYLDPALPKGVVVPTCAVAGQPMITEPKVVLSSASAGFTASATIPPVTTAGTASICVTLARYSGPPEALIDITVVGGNGLTVAAYNCNPAVGGGYDCVDYNGRTYKCTSFTPAGPRVDGRQAGIATGCEST